MAKITIGYLDKTAVVNKSNFPRYIIDLFPVRLRNLLIQLPAFILDELEEIRLRINRPVLLVTSTQHYTVDLKGNYTEEYADGYWVTSDDLEKVLHKISQSSIYAWEEEFKRGYITVPGGHRIGLSGRVILDKGLVKSIKEISGLNFRIARELPGVADPVVPYLIDRDNKTRHTLIISPPRCGKTTLLRDIIRQLSTGIPSLGFKGVNVGLVDERSELAGTFCGVPQFDIGLRTDVLDGCPKAQGMIMLIRSMAPQVIATDEIGTIEDINAMEEVLNAGISLITTVHGKDLMDIRQRPNLKKVIDQRCFQRIIVLSRSLGVGTIEAILDGTVFSPLIAKPLKGKAVS
ncbi:MAG: stage III sporulation protein AA [Clostridia bacterium]|nr:stage III sporulation protein AA [Clostridia bacterium]